jgi:hypothetical protein
VKEHDTSAFERHEANQRIHQTVGQPVEIEP